MQARYALLGLALAAGIAGGAAAFAQQEAEPHEGERINEAIEGIRPLPEPFETQPKYVGHPPQRQRPGTDADTPTAPDAAAFIDEGTTTADRAIEALTSERDELRARLAKVEAELSKWKAVRGALTSAKGDSALDLVPLDEPGPPPPSRDSLDLEPIREPPAP